MKLAEQVKVTTFVATRVAAMAHRGDPAGLDDTIQRFVAWRKAAKLPPSTHATFNIVYGGPADTEPAEYRFDICVAIEGRVPSNEYGIVAKTIQGGRCAVLRHVGSDDNLGEAILALYCDWLPQSEEALRAAPLFFHRVSFPPFVAAADAITDIYLPLK